MASAPIYNPPIPYLGIVDRGFQPGRMVKIQGTVLPSATRFAINLQCGPNVSAGDDIALHFNPRFTDNRIIRNSLQNRAWQQEEFHGNSMPLVRGQGFEIIILCDPHHFKIAVNGHHFAEFVHRLPYQRVTHISIDGDVMVSLLVYEGGLNMAPGGYGAAPLPMAPGMPGAPAGHVYPTLPQAGMPGAQPYPTQPGAYGTPMAGQPGYGHAPTYPPGQYPPGQYPPGPSPTAYNSYPQYPTQPNSGLGGFLGQAGAAIAGALGTAGIMRAMGGQSSSTGYNNPQQYPAPPPSNQGGGFGGYLNQAGAALTGALGTAGLMGVMGGNRSTGPAGPSAGPSAGTSSGGWGNSLSSLAGRMPKTLNDLNAFKNILSPRKF